MSTKKILKFYLITTLSLSSVSLLSFNNGFRDYISSSYASVVDYKYVEAKPYLAVAQNDDANLAQNGEDSFYKENPAQILLSINRSKLNSLVVAGAKNVNFMNLVFGTGPTKAKLKSLDFTIEGVGGSSIKNAYLAQGKEIIATASVSEKRVKFSDIGFDLEAESKNAFTLKVDLSDSLAVGSIITLDIDKAEDIKFEVGGENFSLNGHYPIRGTYLSIAKIR